MRLATLLPTVTRSECLLSFQRVNTSASRLSTGQQRRKVRRPRPTPKRSGCIWGLKTAIGRLMFKLVWTKTGSLKPFHPTLTGSLSMERYRPPSKVSRLSTSTPSKAILPRQHLAVRMTEMAALSRPQTQISPLIFLTVPGLPAAFSIG